MSKTKPTISISYPPLSNQKGQPFLSQNRQFQWTNTGNVIYPVIPAYGASLLKQSGYQVFWDDAISEKISYSDWLSRLKDRKPEVIFFEAKTPTIKTHWKIINEIKDLNLTSWKPVIVLMGDHVTALPAESLKQSKVDFVITGGDYDFMMHNLVSHLFLSQKLEPGFYYKSKSQNGKHKIVNTGPFALKHHQLDSLPFIDRKLTRWELYAYDNTNYKYTPGTYLMSGRDCWWGKCTFCSWTTTHPAGTFRFFSPKRLLDEIDKISAEYGVKEIFDDAGTLPIGPWLSQFCQGLISRGLNKKLRYGCNMRFSALNQSQYYQMGQAGFRFILYGLESNNQSTLDKIKKNTKVEEARKTLIMAKKANLEPHLTIMIGYPWETINDATNTLNEARRLFLDGLADTMQATRIIPYPGTPLFEQCRKNGWLLTENWDDYDMRQPVMKSPISHLDQEKLIQDLFKGILTPKFIYRKISTIRNLDDIVFLSRYAIKYLKKLSDFSINNAKSQIKTPKLQ